MNDELQPAVCPRCGLNFYSEIAESWRTHNEPSAERAAATQKAGGGTDLLTALWGTVLDAAGKPTQKAPDAQLAEANKTVVGWSQLVERAETAERERDAALAQAAAVQEACAKAFDGTTWQPYKHPSEIIRSLLIITPEAVKEIINGRKDYIRLRAHLATIATGHKLLKEFDAAMHDKEPK